MMKKLIIILLFILPFSAIAQWGNDIYQSKLGSCTSLLRNVSAGSQELGVLVTSNGGGVIKRYGMLYSTLYTEPTFPTFYTGSTSVSYYNGELNTFYTTYSFSSQTVYTRGFVETDAGISYGEVIGFTAPSTCIAPQVTLATATNITGTTATSGGNVTNGGTSAVTARGVCWDTEGNPRLPYNYTNDGTGTGSFSSSITGLSEGVTYYYRAYATNSCGTSYSELAQFTTTLSHTVPTLITNAISSITTNSAVSGGTITNDGNATIIEKGLCYKIGSTPISIDNTINSGSGSSSWVTNITGLLPNTEYHVRAWARNSYVVNGFTVRSLGYGQEEIFTTSSSSNIIATLSSAFVSEYSNTIGVNWIVTLDSAAPTNVSIPISITDGTNTGNVNISIAILAGQSTGSYSTNYYKQASTWTAYANFRTMPSGYSGTNTASYIIPALTPSCTVPILATNSITSITTNSATSGGVISSDGGCSITAKGVEWSLYSNFSTIAGSTSDGTGSGNFTSIITGLNENTIYYVRSFATNSIGTGYGNTQSFTTSSISPCSLSVGDSYGGGKIAYFFQSGDPGYVSGECHGIIAASSDQSSGIQWYNGSYVVTDATSEGVLGGGLSNTNKIVSVQGSGSYAAKLCYDLTLNGYSDWVLPNMGELRVLYTNKTIIGGFSSASYWSSYEGTSMYAGLKSFNNGDEQTGNKSANWIYVRSIRYF